MVNMVTVLKIKDYHDNQVVTQGVKVQTNTPFLHMYSVAESLVFIVR